MKRKCKREVQIDALSICYQANTSFLKTLSEVPMEQYVNFSNISLNRVNGRYFDSVFAVRVWKENQEIDFGRLKFNNTSLLDDSVQHNMVWFTISNKILYSDEFKNLNNITNILNIEFLHITHIDLCLDTSINIARKAKRLYTSENYDVILNRKRIKDRTMDNPEVSFQYFGSQNRALKHLTAYFKQKSALNNKNDGITICSYDKKVEVEDVSHKYYILDFYGNPQRLFRTEVRLNRENVKSFLANKYLPDNTSLNSLLDQSFLNEMFFFFMDSVIHFRENRKLISWREILGK